MDTAIGLFGIAMLEFAGIAIVVLLVIALWKTWKR